MFKFNKSSGQASKLLLVLAAIVLVAVIITFLIMKMAEKPIKPAGPDVNQPTDLPVYENTLDNIRLIFVSAIDRGSELSSSTTSKEKLISNPGAKFIQVTIGAQNLRTENIAEGAWNMENIVDSENRNFVAEGTNIDAWLSEKSMCGGAMKPAFDPIQCTRIYEVSKVSTGLKVRVTVGKGSFLMDLIVK